MPSTVILKDIAHIVRSKNAGPFLVTMDVMFLDEIDYLKFKDMGYMSKKKVAELYMVDESDVVECLYYDNARAFKTTIRRHIASGSLGDTDIYGTQQHIPLLMMDLENWSSR